VEVAGEDMELNTVPVYNVDELLTNNDINASTPQLLLSQLLKSEVPLDDELTIEFCATKDFGEFYYNLSRTLRFTNPGGSAKVKSLLARIASALC